MWEDYHVRYANRSVHCANVFLTWTSAGQFKGQSMEMNYVTKAITSQRIVGLTAAAKAKIQG